MSNVLSEEKQQIIALGRLGWSLRRIQRETGIRRETISAYLKETGVQLRPPRGRQLPPKPASPAVEVTTDPTLPKPPGESLHPTPAKPASEGEEVPPDSGPEPAGRTAAKPEPEPGRCPSASACEPYGAAIEVGTAHDTFC
jgi:hypothetical protein